MKNKNNIIKSYNQTNNLNYSKRNDIIHFTKICNKKFKFIENELYYHNKKEPFKLFKDSHKNWEKKSKKLYDEFEKIQDKLILNYKELEKELDSINNSNN